MAVRTRFLVAAATLGWPLRTRETVWWDTPARAATAAIAGPRVVSTPARRSSAPMAAGTPSAWPIVITPPSGSGPARSGLGRSCSRAQRSLDDHADQHEPARDALL